jgi:GDP-4-dehydro-6-deoxy-D-mannose reductase
VLGPPLVTGATGFAGSHLVDQLLEEQPSVAAWCHHGGRAPKELDDPRVRWSAVDLLDRGAVSRAFSEIRPSAVDHCAGIAHVGESWSEPVRALSVNVRRTHNYLEPDR